MKKIKRMVGLDLGSKTCGVALSDPLGFSAQGLTTIRFEENSFKQALRLLKETLKDTEIECFVLGDPKHMNGDIGESSQRSLSFKQRLEDSFKVEVVLWDERMTSVVANNFMIQGNLSAKDRKAKIDQQAAVAILQAYMDSLKHKK